MLKYDYHSSPRRFAPLVVSSACKSSTDTQPLKSTIDDAASIVGRMEKGGGGAKRRSMAKLMTLLSVIIRRPKTDQVLSLAVQLNQNP